MANLGYARVSSTSQDLTIQIDALRAAGCETIFSEKRSGVSTAHRLELRAVLTMIQEGDVLIVTRLDRLARSLPDLFNTLQVLEYKKAGFRALNQPEIDTTTSHGRLLIGILAAVAAFETEIRRERQMEGIRKSLEKGKVWGRTPRIHPAAVREMVKMGLGAGAIARRLGVTRGAIYKQVPGFSDLMAEMREKRERYGIADMQNHWDEPDAEPLRVAIWNEMNQNEDQPVMA